MTMKLLTTNEETGATTSDFTTLIDSTYKLYIFKCIGINPVTDAAHFEFQGNAAGGSGYNETITSTIFFASHDEGNSATGLSYHDGADDQAQGTAFQNLANNVGNGADECAAGTLWLFNPSSTTFQKYFMARFNCYYNSDYTFDFWTGGYFNTTSAIDEIQFKMTSGNFDGLIKLYGVGE
jgi:hypothetical protein